MATLTVWRFDDADGAARAVATLQELRKQELIQLHDAAVVSWEEGRKKPKTRHLADMTGEGALGDGTHAELLQTNLSEQDEQALRAAFAEEA